MVEHLNAVDGFTEKGTNRGEAGSLTTVLVSDPKDGLFRCFNQFDGLTTFGVECEIGNVIAGGDQLTKDRFFPNDLGIGHDIGGARGLFSERCKIGKTPTILKPA